MRMHTYIYCSNSLQLQKALLCIYIYIITHIKMLLICNILNETMGVRRIFAKKGGGDLNFLNIYVKNEKVSRI